MTTLAAIDIGSNGARLLIKRFDPEAPREEDRIKKIMFIRIPLRLGKDVFTLGKVSKEREKLMLICPAKYHKSEETRAMEITTGTKMPLILSARREIGALEEAASSISRTIWESVVSAPTRVARSSR